MAWINAAKQAIAAAPGLAEPETLLADAYSAGAGDDCPEDSRPDMAELARRGVK